MTGDGTVIATMAAGVAHDAAGNPNTASTSTDNTVTYDITAPTVTVSHGIRSSDPTNVADQLHGGLQRAGDRFLRGRRAS